jgi:hypothetical protein
MKSKALYQMIAQLDTLQNPSGSDGHPLTKQPGKEGARRSVILSLLVDHTLFFHPDQHAQLKNKLPAYTVGSLRTNVQVESLVSVIENLIFSGDPQSQW